MSEFDPLRTQFEDSSPTPLTRDIIGLCIGVLSIVLLILIIAICKWSRCECLKQYRHNMDQHEDLTSVILPNSTVPYSYRQHNHNRNQRISTCNHSRNVHPTVITTRNGLLSSPPPFCNGARPHDTKVSHVTITSFSVQTSQQLVPRLSLSPQISGSSITHSINSINP